MWNIRWWVCEVVRNLWIFFIFRCPEIVWNCSIWSFAHDHPAPLSHSSTSPSRSSTQLTSLVRSSFWTHSSGTGASGTVCKSSMTWWMAGSGRNQAISHVSPYATSKSKFSGTYTDIQFSVYWWSTCSTKRSSCSSGSGTSCSLEPPCAHFSTGSTSLWCLAGWDIRELANRLVILLFSRQLNFVGKYLTGIEGYKMVDSQSLRRFVFHFLRQVTRTSDSYKFMNLRSGRSVPSPNGRDTRWRTSMLRTSQDTVEQLLWQQGRQDARRVVLTFRFFLSKCTTLNPSCGTYKCSTWFKENYL